MSQPNNVLNLVACDNSTYLWFWNSIKLKLQIIVTNSCLPFLWGCSQENYVQHRECSYNKWPNKPPCCEPLFLQLSGDMKLCSNNVKKYLIFDAWLFFLLHTSYKIMGLIITKTKIRWLFLGYDILWRICTIWFFF